MEQDDRAGYGHASDSSSTAWPGRFTAKRSGSHDEGIADAPTVDWAMRELGGFRMGPFELMDLIGHDVNFAVTRSVFEAFFYDRRYTPSITQQRLVEAGMLGRKTGRGFYEYGDGSVRPDPSADRALGERVFERILVMLINEAVDAVHWRVASPADIDLAVRKGVNYPKGLLAWGKELGLDACTRSAGGAPGRLRRGPVPTERVAEADRS